MIKNLNEFNLLQTSNPFQIETQTPPIQNIEHLNDLNIPQLIQADAATSASNSISKPVKVLQTEQSKVEKENESILTATIFPTNLEEKKALSEQFKVGDIIVTHLTGFKKIEAVDPFIVILQRIAKFFGRSNKTADHTAVHIAIVVGVDKEKGRVIISEAMPSRSGGLRTVDLFTHDSCRLEKGMGYNYQVFRPTPTYATTAEKAATIALRVAPKAKYLVEENPNTEDGNNTSSKKDKLSKFSFLLALKGIFRRSDTFDLQAKKRLFKGIFDEHIQATHLTGGKGKSRKVFCSAFGAQLFQRAAAEQAWKTLTERHSELQAGLEQLAKETPKDIPNERGAVSKWAQSMAAEYGEELEKEMENFKIDFKFTAPQDFINSFQQNNIIKSIFKINPPAV